MNPPAETYAEANRTLDRWGDAVAYGANTAPRLTIDTIIALRAILVRHRPVDLGRYRVAVCGRCDCPWEECLDSADVLKVLGLPEDDDERTVF